MGLSIVKGLVRLHGGEFSIRSRVGQGTRITVRLPLDCEPARPVKKRSPATVSPLITTANQPVAVGAVPPSVTAVKKRA